MADRFAARCARPGFGPWARTALLSAVCAAALAALAGPALAKGGASAAACQPYSAKPCLFPYPDNRLTRPDHTSATKLRVNLPGSAMPVNTKGVRIRTAAWDRNDGFSPGSTIVLHIPGLDNAAALKRTGVVPITNIAQSLAKRQPIVVIDQATGARQLIWAELDTNATSAGQHRSDDPPGARTPGRGPHLRRRAAQPAHRRRASSSRPRSGSRCCATAASCPAAERRQAARYAAHLQGAQARRDRAEQEPVRGVELHRRLAPEPDRAACWRSATTPSRSSATPTSPTPSTPGHAPAFAVTEHQAARLRRRGAAAHPGRRAPSRSRATWSSAVPVGPAGLPLQLVQARRDADADPGQRRDDDVRVRRAEHRDRPDAGADLALRPRAAGLRGRGHGDADARRWRSGTTSCICSTTFWGLANDDTLNDAAALGNLNLFGAVIDRLQQGALNMLYLGA